MITNRYRRLRALIKALSGGLSERTRDKVKFEQDDFDFFFQWFAGLQTHGGVESGEIFYAASKITDGDTESWVNAWTSLSHRVEARARSCLERGHCISARQAFFRAYNYRRAPLVFLRPSDERYRPTYEAAQRLFQVASSLCEPALESFPIPFEAGALSGYLLRPDETSKAKKTLMMFGGGDTFVEDLYFYIGPAGLERGYNVVIVDLPGQGILPDDGLVMRPDVEVPMKAIVDHVLSYPDVDAESLAAYGISAGGYLVPRAATVEKRIRACVASSAILNFHEVWTRNTSLHRLAQLEGSPLMWLIEKLPLKKAEAVSRLVSTYTWRWGVESVSDLLDVSKSMVFEPNQLTCPTLVLIGAQEYEKFEASREWAHRCVEEAQTSRKELIVTPREEGADTHAIGTNLSLMAQTVFDWLDETFDAHATMNE